MKIYYDINEFPFLSPLKENWEKIKHEYDSIRSNAIIWPDLSMHNGKLEAIPLRFEGRDCPMLQHTPTLIDICSDPIFYSFGFSIFRSGGIISPHTGITDKLLRVHLTLCSNDMCGIVIGGQEYNWKDGDLMIFDDTFEHFAWNKGSTDRVILMLDFFKNGEITEVRKDLRGGSKGLEALSKHINIKI